MDLDFSRIRDRKVILENLKLTLKFKNENDDNISIEIPITRWEFDFEIPREQVLFLNDIKDIKNPVVFLS